MTQGSLRHNDGRTRGVSLYLQDDWQVHPKVTLSGGLRWDPFFAFWDLDQPQPVFRPGQRSTLFPSAPLGPLYAGDPGIPTGGHPSGEQLRATYRDRLESRPEDECALGYGLFYDSSRDFQGPSSLTFTPPYSVTSTANGIQFSDPYAGMVNPFPMNLQRHNRNATTTRSSGLCVPNQWPRTRGADTATSGTSTSSARSWPGSC